MGHATHFLQRLQRSTAAQADRALKLYNNPDLVRHIIDQLQPDSTLDRMVWSLDENDNGPFLLLTREGGFVTCLAKGMAVEGLFQVNFKRLVALWEKAEERLRKIEDVRKWQQQTGNSWEDLLHLLTTQGDDFDREMFLRIASLQPVLRVQMLSHLLQRFERLLQLQPTLTSTLKHTSSHNEADFRDYWNQVWSMSHLSTLLACEGQKGLGELQEFFDLLQENAPSDGPSEVVVLRQLTSLFWPAFRQGLVPIALRAVWGMGRLGKPLVTPLKQKLQSMDSFLTWTMAFLGLSCIALRHHKLRKEIAKTLYSQTTKPSSIQALQRWNVPESTLGFTIALVQGEAVSQQELNSHFQTAAFGMLQGHTLPDEFQFKQPSDIPEGIASSLVSNASGNWIQDTSELMRMTGLLPWLANVDAQQLYLPTRLVEALSAPWQSQSVIDLLQTHQDYYGASQPLRKERQIGRNDPCPCGSGKKYKKCCMRSV